jgi:hypothetical protein
MLHNLRCERFKANIVTWVVLPLNLPQNICNDGSLEILVTGRGTYSNATSGQTQY